MSLTGNTESHGGTPAPPQSAPPQSAPPQASTWPASTRVGTFLQFLFLGISLLLSAFSAWVYESHPYYQPFTAMPLLMYPAGIAFIVALLSSSFILLIPWPHTNRIVRVCAGVLFIGQLVVVFISTIRGSRSAVSLPALFSVLGFGFCGMGIALCVAVLWIRPWKLAESAVMGLLGVMAIFLCLPGILFFTKPLDGPQGMSSEVYVFATGTPAQRLSVNVVLNPSTSDFSLPSGDLISPGEESITVHNGSNHTIHWAVLLDNGACFTVLKQVPAKVTHRDVDIDADLLSGGITVSDSFGYDTTPAQLFTGVLAGNSSATFFGTVTGTFETNTISWTAAYFPTYSQGSLSGVSSKTDRAMIINALGSAPTARDDGAFTITLTGAVYDPSLESLSDAQPSLDSTLQGEGVPQWTGHESIFNPQYKLLSLNGADEATDGLFVFAVFLGIAGASLLASLQCVVKILLDRKSLDSVRSEKIFSIWRASP